MKANDGHYLTWFHLAQATVIKYKSSCIDSPGQDASPSQVPSQQCWYSFAAEYTEANRGK